MLKQLKYFNILRIYQKLLMEIWKPMYGKVYKVWKENITLPYLCLFEYSFNNIARSKDLFILSMNGITMSA